MIANLNRQVELLSTCCLIKEKEVKALCDKAKEILAEAPNVTSIGSPVTVCGDIHGQFFDLLELFRNGGEIPLSNYVFMGDFVDRGFYSVETFLYLLSLKVRYPKRITLLRGNHESRQITQVYGFYDECLRKYGSMNVWKYCTDIFDFLPLAVIIEGKVFCVHGGLSPNLSTVNQIQKIDRKIEIPHDGGMCDLLWSDPDTTVDNWGLSQRGAGYLFGKIVVNHFCHANGVEMILRAHQLAMEGHKEFFNKKLITIWSAPNYCYRCGNYASILEFDEHMDWKYITFEAAHADDRLKTPKVQMATYFL